MEFYYSCVTCAHVRRKRDSPVVYDHTKMWCVSHLVSLPTGKGSKDAICCDFEPRDPRATEWKSVIEKFPKRELWTFELYRPSRKLAVIAELPKINSENGDVVES